MPDLTISQIPAGQGLAGVFDGFPEWLMAQAVVEASILPNAHPMNVGVDAECARITADGGEKLFLKVASADQRRWFLFDNAAQMARMAGEAGLSPRLLAVDEGRGAFLFEGLGEEWKPAITLQARARDVRAALLDVTRALHGLAPLERSVSVFERIADLRKLMAEGVPHVASGAPRKVVAPEKFAEMSAVVDAITQGFAAASHDLAPCHVENSLSNFMLGPGGQLRVVDFDRAANGDPLADIGALCNEYYREEADVAQTVEIYAGRVERQIVARVKLHMILAAYHWGMWGKVSHAASCRPEIEYYKYGENQFMRCAFLIAHWDVGQLIGEM